MDIKEAQRLVDEWIQKYGVRYFDELTNTILLSEEVGEFSKLMARQYGEQSFKSSVDKNNVPGQIADEMADIIFVLICLANQMGIDLETSIKMNLQKKTSRDKDRHLNNPKLK